jgi:hypothetical protein
MDEVWEAMNREFVDNDEQFRIMTSEQSEEFQKQYKELNGRLEVVRRNMT